MSNSSKNSSNTRTFRFMALEGPLIVVSILLAFALDTMWEERKREQEARIALASLKAEFEKNLIECEDVRITHFDNAKAFANLLKQSEETILKMNDEEATRAYSRLITPRTFDPLVGTARSVMNAGTFSILQDESLRKDLEIFLNLTEDTREDISNMLHFMRITSEFEVSMGGPWGNPEDSSGWPGKTPPDISYERQLTAEKLLELLNTPEYLGRVKLFYGSSTWYSSELERLSDHIKKLLTTIDIMLEAN